MMQIPNVDIRRLQNLSDSINRTIDALNQVRLSVYANVTPSVFGVMPGIGGLTNVTGLGHTAFDAAYADPYSAARIAATYPFSQWGYASQDTWPTI